MALTLAGWSVLFLSAQPQAVQRYLAFPGRFGRASAKITGTGKAFNSGPAGAAGVEPAQGHARTAEAHIVTSFFAVVQTRRARLFRLQTESCESCLGRQR